MPALPGNSLLFRELNSEPFSHPIKRAPVDAKDTGGTRAPAANYFQNMQQVPTLELIERREIIKERRQG